MAFTKGHLPTELKKLAEGKRTRTPAAVLHLMAADIAVEALAAEPEVRDDVQFLERLFLLKDTR